MPKVLHIFDVSPIIHAGHVNKRSRLEQLVDMGTTWKTQVTPTGGASFLFNTLYNVIGTGDVVMCCDRNPTIKKDMLPTYKHNRAHRRDMQVDKAAAEYILKKCNCTVLAREGYEADDFIYSLVKKFHNNYDEIYIYTGDSDLYFLVDDKVSIKPSSSRAKEVTIHNYEQIAIKGGIKYNCLTAYKILKGDTSDCIPAMDKHNQEMFMSVFYREQFYEHLGDKNFVLEWARTLCPGCIPQIELVFPLDVDELPDEFLVPDKQAIINFGDAMNNSLFRNRASQDFDIKPYIAEMQSRGLYIEED